MKRTNNNLKSVTAFVTSIKNNKALMNAYNYYHELCQQQQQAKDKLQQAEQSPTSPNTIEQRIQLRAEIKEYEPAITKAEAELQSQRVKAGLINPSNYNQAGDKGNEQIKKEIQEYKNNLVKDMMKDLKVIVQLGQQVSDYQLSRPDTIKNQIKEIVPIISETKARQLIQLGNSYLWLYTDTGLDEMLDKLRKVHIL